MFKKILTISLLLFFISVRCAFGATNTKSIDLESSSSQYLSITDANQTGLDITGDISFEAWVKIEQLPSSAGANFKIFNKDNGSGGRGYLFHITTGNDLQVQYLNSGGISYATTNNATFTAGDVGEWVHIAACVDVSSASFYFYKNSVLQSDTVSLSQASSITNNSEDFLIGARIVGSSYSHFFDGLIDEAIIWNDIRTATEIGESYNSGNGKIYVGNEANMQGYWRFEDALLDETSNDNDLTNNNSAAYSVDVPFSGSTPATTRRVMFIN